MTKLVLGIDLGTTNSVAHIWNGNSHITIKNNNSNLFPSVIEFTDKGKKICNNKYDYNNTIKNHPYDQRMVLNFKIYVKYF